MQCLVSLRRLEEANFLNCHVTFGTCAFRGQGDVFIVRPPNQTDKKKIYVLKRLGMNYFLAVPLPS
jgi:hypothetical protein